MAHPYSLECCRKVVVRVRPLNARGQDMQCRRMFSSFTHLFQLQKSLAVPRGWFAWPAAKHFSTLLMLRTLERGAPLRRKLTHLALINRTGQLARGMSQIIVVNKLSTMILERNSLNTGFPALTLVFSLVRVSTRLPLISPNSTDAE